MRPKIIALCGHPKSGKNEVGRILAERYGAVMIDDGEPLRLALPMLFRGIEIEDCMTQEGKTKPHDILGNTFTVRKMLGDLGQILEDRYGEFYLSEQAYRKMNELPKAPYFVMTACRKRQGHFWNQLGGMTFEIDRGMEPSPHAFDWFDTTAVADVIDNHGTIDDLEAEVARVMFHHFRDSGYTRLVQR